MMPLDELQRTAQASVLGGGPPPAVLERELAPPAAERWAIYVDAYRLRLVDALATQYPALASRLGRDQFDACARRFIAAQPSTHRSLRDYGSELPAFLLAGADTDEARMQSDLAAFEWRLAAAFDAPDASACTIAELAGLAPDEWPGLCFAAVPSLQRLSTRSNAVAVWREARQTLQRDPAAGPLAAPAAEYGATAHWLIVRPALDTEFRSLAAAEAAALDQLLAGASFAELCEQLSTSRDDAAVTAATWLKGWLTEGLLLRV